MSDDNFPSKILTDTALTRRSFLKWNAVLGGAAAMAGGVSFGLKPADPAVAGAAPKQGKWIPAACWADCGGKGFNRAYVIDGVVVRMGTDDTIPDTPDNPQLRSCAKGRSQRNHLFSADRLKYPMKRKNWAPGGGKKELRGHDEWIRISWDEALDAIASEMKRIKSQYGNAAIQAAWTGVYMGRAFGLFGGFVDHWGNHSSGTWSAFRGITGFAGAYNDRFDLRTAQLIVLWGSNPAWSRAGNPTYNYLQCKKAGAKFISIDPFYHPTAQVLADEWIPVRPATDTPLLLGMAHTLLTEDDPKTNPLIDWDFLSRCTVGFDRDHMPKGADPKENFKDYVLGSVDGTPKTAEWASEFCGVPPETIRTLAREIAQTEKVAICMSPAPSRVNNGDCLPHAVLAFGAMTGHIGKPGSMVGYDSGHKTVGNGGALLVNGGWNINSATYTRAKPITNPLAGNLVAGAFYMTRPEGNTTVINMNELWTSILEGKYTAGYKDIRNIDIRMIYHGHGSRMNQLAGTMKAIEAHRKVEFVVTQNMFMTTDAKYSDIVLPVTSQWERFGNLAVGYREQLLWTSQIMEPYFESKDDSWIARELGKRLGLDEKQIEPWSLKQELINEVADATVVKEDGKTTEPLVTITEQDLAELGVEGKPQKGRMPIKEFKEKGIYHVLRKPGDNYYSVALKEFRDDPVKNVLKTPSGKLEIHCQAYADYIKNCGWSEISPIPKYVKPIEGYEDTFKDWKSQAKGEYPLQFYSIHVLRRAHSTFENSPWLREAFLHSVMMNPIDAAARGIKDGDDVLVTSRHGKVLRPVLITENIMPGVATLGQGGWPEIDEATGIDKGGCANVLSGAIATGQGQVGWNSVNIQVTKWTGEPLKPDYTWPQRIPIKGDKI